jgi:hypothetical protein
MAAAAEVEEVEEKQNSLSCLMKFLQIKIAILKLFVV